MSSYPASPSPHEEKLRPNGPERCIIEQGMLGEAEFWMKDILGKEMEQTMFFREKISVIKYDAPVTQSDALWGKEVEVWGVWDCHSHYTKIARYHCMNHLL